MILSGTLIQKAARVLLGAVTQKAARILAGTLVQKASRVLIGTAILPFDLAPVVAWLASYDTVLASQVNALASSGGP